MLDVRYIREFPDQFDAALAKRSIDPMSDRILSMDERKRSITSDIQAQQSERNSLAALIGSMKRDGKNSETQEKRAIEIKQKIQNLSEDLDSISAELTALLSTIPNLLDEDVPFGLSEEENVEIKKIGTKPEFTFTPRPHYDVGVDLGVMDFENAAKIAGSRFVVLKGDLSRMERALAAFMIDSHKDFGYTEYTVPLLVNSETVYGTAQLPKFKDDLFQTTDGRWLIPTAEVSLTNLVRERILDEKQLPLRMTAYTQCFRSEAGAAGRDTVGMLRQHQFSKVELVSVTTPEKSAEEHEIILAAAENILKKLDLHYRVVRLCSGDTGFSSSKTYDIEVWMPSQGVYREISSCSNCRDFQARRMNARYKDSDLKNRFVHTLNGSGLAIGRTIIAIMENYQSSDGSITIPDALSKYMGTKEIKNVKVLP